MAKKRHKQKPMKVESIEKRYGIGNLKTKAAGIEIENPNYSRDHAESKTNPRFIVAYMNMENSLAAHWYYKNMIDKAELRAAKDFRMYWERAGGSGAAGMDYSKVVVDGGLRADPVSVTQLEAVKALASIQDALGRDGFYLVEKLCGEEVALKVMFPTRHKQITKSELCREMLNVLAVFLGHKERITHAHERA